jgi:hypothetical protein
VGFIREKGKATAQVKAGVFMDVLTQGWGGVPIGRAFHRLFQVNWCSLHLYWGSGSNLESTLLISPVADLSDSVSLL